MKKKSNYFSVKVTVWPLLMFQVDVILILCLCYTSRTYLTGRSLLNAIEQKAQSNETLGGSKG